MELSGEPHVPTAVTTRERVSGLDFRRKENYRASAGDRTLLPGLSEAWHCHYTGCLMMNGEDLA
jgi:hypothetical protein